MGDSIIKPFSKERLVGEAKKGQRTIVVVHIGKET